MGKRHWRQADDFECNVLQAGGNAIGPTDRKHQGITALCLHKVCKLYRSHQLSLLRQSNQPTSMWQQRFVAVDNLQGFLLRSRVLHFQHGYFRNAFQQFLDACLNPRFLEFANSNDVKFQWSVVALESVRYYCKDTLSQGYLAVRILLSGNYSGCPHPNPSPKLGEGLRRWFGSPSPFLGEGARG